MFSHRVELLDGQAMIPSDAKPNQALPNLLGSPPELPLQPTVRNKARGQSWLLIVLAGNVLILGTAIS